MIAATQGVMLTTVALLIIWDILAVLRGGVKATISYQLHDLGTQFPILVFALGVLCGHWFWPI